MAGGKQYESVASWLRQAISAGEYPRGDALPGESDLADEYGVSRWVIREALRLLADEGLITKRSGRRTTVATTGEVLRRVRIPAGSRIAAVIPTPSQQEAAGSAPGEPVLIVARPGQLDALYPAGRTVLVVDGRDTPLGDDTARGAKARAPATDSPGPSRNGERSSRR